MLSQYGRSLSGVTCWPGSPDGFNPPRIPDGLTAWTIGTAGSASFMIPRHSLLATRAPHHTTCFERANFTPPCHRMQGSRFIRTDLPCTGCFVLSGGSPSPPSKNGLMDFVHAAPPAVQPKPSYDKLCRSSRFWLEKPEAPTAAGFVSLMFRPPKVQLAAVSTPGLCRVIQPPASSSLRDGFLLRAGSDLY